MTNELNTTRDGFDVPENRGGGMLRGKIIKYLSDRDCFVVDKLSELRTDTTLVAVDVITAWVHWRGGKPIQHLVTKPGQRHPDQDELPDRDQNLWEVGLNGDLADPWHDTRYLYLINPATGEEFTFVTETWGGRSAIGDLKAQIANVRCAHPRALPIVKLTSGPMKTRFGSGKRKPRFEVVGWRGSENKSTILPQTQPEQQNVTKLPTSQSSRRPETATGSLSIIDDGDEIPF
jgi:hypothetical protein